MRRLGAPAEDPSSTPVDADRCSQEERGSAVDRVERVERYDDRDYSNVATVEGRSRIRLISAPMTVTIATVDPATDANAIRTYASASGAFQLLKTIVKSVGMTTTPASRRREAGRVELN